MRGRREQPLGASGMPVRPLGATLRAWRHYRQLSLSALAIRAGLGQSGLGYISKIEHGSIREPSEGLLGRLAEALDVRISTLLLHLPPEGEAAAGPTGPES